MSFLSFKSKLNNNFNKSNEYILDNNKLLMLQNVLLEIYNDFITVCKKYNLKPFISGGSCLGMIRHNGFIPWDDDIDLSMSRYDFEKFKTIFQSEMSDKYILKVPNSQFGSTCRFMKIYKKQSHFESIYENNSGLNKIAIDIFQCDYVPNNIIIRYCKGFLANILMFITSCVETFSNGRINDFNSVQFMLVYKFRVFIGFLFSFYKLSKWYDIIDSFIQQKEETDYITFATGRKHYIGEIIEKSVVFPLKSAKFCFIDAYIMNKPEEYLENLYGSDYMVVPPEDKREHHYVKNLKFNEE